MKTQLRSYVSIFLIFVIFPNVFAQNNRAYKEVQNYRKANTKNRIAKLRDIPNEDYLADMGYDSTDVANLEKIGIHIDSLSRKMDLSEKEKTIRAECIVIGTVIAVEYSKMLPQGEYPAFGTTAYVYVEEFLRNDYDLPKGPIPVLIESGRYMKVMHEDTLGVGEHVLLFLSSKYMLNWVERYKPDFYQKAINDSTIQFQIIGYISKYRIQSGKIFNEWKRETRNLAEVREEILRVVAQLQHKNSYYFPQASGQANPVYRDLQKNRKSDLKEGLNPRDGRTRPIEFDVDMGYTDTTIQKLKSIGVDVDAMRFQATANEKEKALRSDCIVIGKVTEIEHPIGDTTKVWDYSTIAYIGVEEYLRNDYNVPKGKIPVMIVSGPTRQLVSEETLELGEHVLLFLSAKYLFVFTDALMQEKMPELINDPTIRFRLIPQKGKYVIQSDSVLNNGIVKKLDTVQSDIMTIVNIVSPHQHESK